MIVTQIKNRLMVTEYLYSYIYREKNLHYYYSFSRCHVNVRKVCKELLYSIKGAGNTLNARLITSNTGVKVTLINGIQMPF